MRELRAVVLGLFILLLIALGINAWNRPGREYRRIRGYRVEISKTETGGGGRKHVAFTVPMSALARIASLAPVSDIGGNAKADWGEGQVTARDILDAAERSKPGEPGIIEKDHKKIEVQADGAAIEIHVTDDWNKSVRVRLPRSLVQSFSDDSRVSPRDILRRLDEMGPGDVVVVKDRDEEVTITAQGR
jgi:CelD/BcsL family acetyltransferase involved in cellulose biosynthesis